MVVFFWSNMRLDYSRKLFPRCFGDILRDVIFCRIHNRIFCSFNDSNISVTIRVFFLEFIYWYSSSSSWFSGDDCKQKFSRDISFVFLIELVLHICACVCTTKIARIRKMKFEVPLKIWYYLPHFSLFSISEFMGFYFLLTYRTNNISCDLSIIRVFRIINFFFNDGHFPDNFYRSRQKFSNNLPLKLTYLTISILNIEK